MVSPKKNMSIGTQSLAIKRYLIHAVIAVTFAIIIFSSFIAFHVWRQTKEEMIGQLSTVMEMGEKAMSTYINQIESSLQSLSESLLDNKNEIALKRAHDLLIRYKASHPEMLNVNLADVSGQGLVSANFPYGTKLPSVGNEESFIQSREELMNGSTLSIARPFIGKQIKKWVSQLRYGIRNDKGELKYIIFAVLPIEMLEVFWKGAPIMKHSVIGLLRDDAYLLNRYPVPDALSLAEVYSKPRRGTLINYLRDNLFPESGVLEGKNSVDLHGILYSFRRLSNRAVTLFIMVPIPYIVQQWFDRVKFPGILLMMLISTIFGTFYYFIKKEIALQEEREGAAAKLVSSANLAVLGTMAGGIAHEIKNPLAGIMLRTTVIRDHAGSNKLTNEVLFGNLEKIDTLSKRIVKIINGLKTFSRNTDNDPMAPVNINSIVEDTLEMCQERFRARNIKLKVENLTQSKTIECRATQIGQILLNLLSNASDAIEQLNDKWISLIIKEQNDKIQFIVTDSGSGIPREVADKLMRPFFTTKEVGKGTGLGLSISYGIAEDHGGKLYYDSSSPNTRFVLEIPITQSNSESASIPKSA